VTPANARSAAKLLHAMRELCLFSNRNTKTSIISDMAKTMATLVAQDIYNKNNSVAE
jgi:hypothetical protein